VFNVGGGRARSVSLAELTGMCREQTGRSLSFGRDAETHASDVPYYVTDNSLTTQMTSWAPRHGLDVLLDDIFKWLRDHRLILEPILGFAAR